MNTDCRFAAAALQFLFTCLVLNAAAGAQSRPADLVDPLVGTANEGQTFPAAGVPFAMTQWTPATRDGQRKGLVPYYFADTQFHGFRGSHFLSGSATQDSGSSTLKLLVEVGWFSKCPASRMPRGPLRLNVQKDWRNRVRRLVQRGGGECKSASHSPTSRNSKLPGHRN